MATRKKSSTKPPAEKRSEAGHSAALSSAHSTVSGPAHDDAPARSTDTLLVKQRGTQELAASFPANPNKRAEYGEASRVPTLGVSRKPDSPLISSSTVTE